MRIRWWVEGIRLAGFIPVVLDDGRDPLPGTARGWLESAGVEYRQTVFHRRGNLNGTDVAAEICAELAAAAARHGTDHALKVDDDTVILDPELFSGQILAGAVGLTWAGDRRGGAYGMAYSLRIDVAEAIAEHLRGLPVDRGAPEDLTVWAAARAIVGEDQLVRHEFAPDAGPFSALPIGAEVKDAVERFGVLTVGNEPPGGWGNRQMETASRLWEVVRAAGAMALQRGG